MAKQNTLYMIIGALVVVVIALGVYMWQEEQKTGVEIEIGRDGISVQEK